MKTIKEEEAIVTPPVRRPNGPITQPKDLEPWQRLEMQMKRAIWTKSELHWEVREMVAQKMGNAKNTRHYEERAVLIGPDPKNPKEARLFTLKVVCRLCEAVLYDHGVISSKGDTPSRLGAEKVWSKCEAHESEHYDEAARRLARRSPRKVEERLKEARRG